MNRVDLSLTQKTKQKTTLLQTKCIETNHQLSHSRSAVHQIRLQEEE